MSTVFVVLLLTSVIAVSVHSRVVDLTIPAGEGVQLSPDIPSDQENRASSGNTDGIKTFGVRMPNPRQGKRKPLKRLQDQVETMQTGIAQRALHVDRTLKHLSKQLDDVEIGNNLWRNQIQKSLAKFEDDVHTLNSTVSLIQQEVAERDACSADPPSISHSHVMVEVGQSMTRRGVYVCEDRAVPCGGPPSILCHPESGWETPQFQCEPTQWTDLAVPAKIQLPCGVAVGTAITLYGVLTSRTYFTLNVIDADADVVFRATSRFSFIDNYVIVANTNIDGHLGTESVHRFRDEANFPFTVNMMFSFTVTLQRAQFQVSVDDADLFSFNFRKYPTFPLSLAVDGYSLRIEKVAVLP